jgi:hypothetical protein
VTQFNKDENVYATLEAPGTIEEALEYAQNAFDLNAPLSDLIYRDAYKILTQNVLSGHYVGLHLVRGVQCHHLVFVQDDIDWQIWIENSHTPLPRKMVITSKWLAGGPGGRYVRPMPAYRRTARRVYRRHDRFRTGAYVYSLPSDCREEVVSGKTYYYCDGMYYQAYYQGNDLVYVEVGDPR